MSVQTYALCPAPVADAGRFPLEQPGGPRCLVRLPCETHNIHDPQWGFVLYGHAFIEKHDPTPARRSPFRRFRGRKSR